jgi:hypothetical protein
MAAVTTIDAVGVGFRAARQAKRADAVATSGVHTEPGVIARFLARLGSALLTLCALAAFCVAAFSVHTALGLVVTGLALLVAEWRLSPADTPQTRR